MTTTFALAHVGQTFVFQLAIVDGVTLSPISIIFSLDALPDWNVERSVFANHTNFIFRNNTTAVHTASDARLIWAALKTEGWYQI